MAIELMVNGSRQALAAATPDEPLLWVLREDLGLVGAKFGCGQGLCGACTVRLDGLPSRACITPCSAALGKAVQTVEGLASSDKLHAVQQAWAELRVAQCGFCQAGQMMSAAALLDSNPKPTDAQIDAAMEGNLCRCGTYGRIRAAIHRAAVIMGGKP
jgi:isoquinoline 1-oxidoreductase subunit alpha